MLKYLNSMGCIHWLLMCAGLFALFSLGKLVAGFMLLVAVIACVVLYWGKVSRYVNKLFGKGEV